MGPTTSGLTIPRQRIDCVVIGAGPAGMTAATYLARFRRSVLVVDHGKSRALKIPLSHNIPGFAEGISGADILRRHEEQLLVHGVGVEAGRVSEAHAVGELGFRLVLQRDDGSRHDVEARTVLVATGVSDKEPPLADVGSAINEGLIRICPVCDAYEVTDQNIAILGNGRAAIGEAVFMRTYSETVSLLLYGGTAHLTDEDLGTLVIAGVRIVREPVSAVRTEANKTTIVLTADGAEHRFDTLYSALGTQANSGLAVALGAHVEESCNAIVVDEHQRTTVPGVWACGDVVSSLNQVSVAWGHAAVAATDIHNHLRSRRP
jgi:thioredoxin reductase (NADPH)